MSRHMRFYFNIKKGALLTRWLRKEARSGTFRTSTELAEGFGQLAEVCIADARASGRMELADGDHERNFGRLLATLAGQMPVRTADLRYNSRELLVTLGKQRLMGDFLRTALSRVQDGGLSNTPEALGAAAARWAARYRCQ